MGYKTVKVFVWIFMPIGLPIFLIGMLARFLSGYFVVGWKFYADNIS